MVSRLASVLRVCVGGRIVFVSAVFGLVFLLAGCGSSTSALDEVEDVLDDIEKANPPESYRFTYTVVSPFFMACMSGGEDVEGVVDNSESIMVLTSKHRAGDVYSLDGELLIQSDLLDLGDSSTSGDYARVRLSAETDAATRSRIDEALGTSLSSLVSGGAWPSHPNETVRSLIPVASSITSIETDNPSQRGIRIVLDADAYAKQLNGTVGSGSEIAPIVDVYVASDGTVERLVARRPDDADPAALQDHSEGYAMDYDYDTQTSIEIPKPETIFNITAAELPEEPTPITCQLDS